jgi:hypothetical protein
MMTSIPWELFEDFVKGDDIKNTGIGMFFLPQVWRSSANLRVALDSRASLLFVLGGTSEIFITYSWMAG